MADFTASGVGSAEAVGASVANSAFLSACSGAAAATGVIARQGQGASVGVSGGTVVGRKSGVGVGSSAGVDVASGAGVSSQFTIAASSGSSAVVATGVSVGIFSSAGTSTAGAVPSTAEGIAVGSSTAIASLSSSNAVSVGASTASSVSSVVSVAVGASQGLSPVTGRGGVSWDSLSRETDVLLGIRGLTFVQTANETSSHALAVAVTSVSLGDVAETLDLLEIRRSTAQAVGESTAASYTLLVETLVSSGGASSSENGQVQATNVSAATASNAIVVVHRKRGVGSSAGTATATAPAVDGRDVVGASVGSSSASSAGRVAVSTVAAAAGTSSALGAGTVLSAGKGFAAGVGAATSSRSGRQLETLVSNAEAMDALLLPLPAVYPVFWSNTIGASGAVWEGLPFNSMIEVDGVIYAAGASGLCQLDDLADDNGTDVLASVQWDMMDRSDYKQRARSIYIHAIADGPFTVTVENKQGQFSYLTHLSSSSKMVNHRTPIGRGITSRAMRLGLQQNRYFSVSDLNLESGDTTRRI